MVPADEHVDAAVEIFRMLADPTRVRLLWSLQKGERSVNELADAVDRPAAAVSQHLAKLRLARLVGTRREGTFVHYSLADEHVAQLVRDAVHHTEHTLMADPTHHRATSSPLQARRGER